MDLVFRLKANYFSLVGGILISLSTSCFASATLNVLPVHLSKWTVVLAASFFLVSAFLFTILSMSLEKLNDLINSAPTRDGLPAEFLEQRNNAKLKLSLYKDREEARQEIFSPKLRKLSFYLASSIILVIIGFILLLLPF